MIMPALLPGSSRKRSAFPQGRLLFVLWVVFFSVLSGHFYVSSSSGYTPVNHVVSVKAASTISEKQETHAFFSVISEEVGEEKFVPTPTPTPGPYGVARQIGEYTWTINVADDDRAGTPQEIFQALNDYRQKKGRNSLSWNGKLASYAQSRADTFAGIQKTDAHAGFIDYLHNQDGFTKLGFLHIGENSSYGYKVLAVHLIEWVYAGDKPHDDNQLSPDWTSVGVGVNGLATDLVFAGNPQ